MQLKNSSSPCRWTPSSALAALAATLGIALSGAAGAQVVNNPPLLPQEITVFPERDFMSLSGFAPNADVVVQVRRAGVQVSDARGRTDASGFLEVNHPGGVCWRNVTPDIAPADVVRVIYRDTSHNVQNNPAVVIGSGAAATTQNVTATQAVEKGETVVITGRAQLASGSRIPLDRFEVRIINPDFGGTRIGRRDIRADSAGGRVENIAGAMGTLAYDGTANTFTAVFTGLNAAERQLAVEGQTRVLGWQATTAAGDRLGMTIYEVGESGGPGMGGCPPGPNGAVLAKPPTAPVFYDPGSLLNAANSASQMLLKDVTVFPERDFISIAGFSAGTTLQVVVRRGTSAAPVVGTAYGTVGRDGVFEVNHPGGVCWSGQTPDIRAGDMVDVFIVKDLAFQAGQTQQVIDTRVTRAAFLSRDASGLLDGRVRVNGTAVDALGEPLPLRLMEQRIIQPDFNNTRIGRRDIRADTTGGRVENVPGGRGDLLRTGTGSEWRAVYTGLNATEQQLAVAGQSRAMAWLSTNGNGDRFGMTIFEFGQTSGPGMSGCPAMGNASIPLPVRFP